MGGSLSQNMNESPTLDLSQENKETSELDIQLEDEVKSNVGPRLQQSSSPNVKALVYDFDCTISSEHVYHNLNKLSLGLATGTGTLAEMQCKRLNSISYEQVLVWFGGKARLQRLNKHFELLKDKGRTLLIISHGFESVVKAALRRVGLDTYFKPGDIYGCDSKGMRDVGAIKSKLITKLMARDKLRRGELVFIDDDKDNLYTAAKLCQTFLVPLRKGLTFEEMKAVEKLAGL